MAHLRIVITGGTGNVGSALLRRLGPDGHHLTALSRRIPEVAEPGPVSWVPIDLTEDGADVTLRHVLEGADAVVHLAWGFQPSHDPAYLERLGVGGTRRVVRAVVATGVPHLVHMSSLGAYSPKRDDQPVDESWPTDGVPTSPYSRHKVAAERILDDFERRGSATTVTRFRPGVIGQAAAGSALLRYGVPALVPSRLLTALPVLPLDRRLRLSMVHADDVADAVARALERRLPGPFNLAAEPPVTTRRIADAMGARSLHLPSPVLRTLMAASWRAHLQQVDPGWLDMAFALPLLDSTRARDQLEWVPQHDADAVLREVLHGMSRADSARTPVLRPRTVLGALEDLARRGPVGRRTRP